MRSLPGQQPGKPPVFAEPESTEKTFIDALLTNFPAPNSFCQSLQIMNATNTKKRAGPPENILYRSRIEIFRVLKTLANESCSIHADIGTSSTFITKILLVDTLKDRLVISYCANKLLNSKLLKLPSIKFTASYQDARLAFTASNPAETIFEDQPAIQMDLPKALTSCHHRESPRIHISATPSLRCIAEVPISAVTSLRSVTEANSVITFETHICDISHDGLGGMLYDSDVKLETGTVLKGCRIFIPNGKAVVADLELRHTTMVALPDGSFAHRVGLRFIQKPDEIAELINFFVQDLDKK